FMIAFPDMVVRMDSATLAGPGAVFAWIWTGTNSGPGGTGKRVRMTGYEEWTFAPDGLIAESKGHFDEAEYQRQLTSAAPPEQYPRAPVARFADVAAQMSRDRAVGMCNRSDMPATVTLYAGHTAQCANEFWVTASHDRSSVRSQPSCSRLRLVGAVAIQR